MDAGVCQGGVGEAAGDSYFSRRRSSFPVVNQTRRVCCLQEWVCFPVVFRPSRGRQRRPCVAGFFS